MPRAHVWQWSGTWIDLTEAPASLASSWFTHRHLRQLPHPTWHSWPGNRSGNSRLLCDRWEGLAESYLIRRKIRLQDENSGTLAASSRTPSACRALRPNEAPAPGPHVYAPIPTLLGSFICTLLMCPTGIPGAEGGALAAAERAWTGWGTCGCRAAHLVPFFPYSPVYCVTLGKLLNLPEPPWGNICT